jgi:ER membrane protein complex subunit 1
LVTTPSTIYVIGLSKYFASYTLHVTSLLSSTGELVASVDFPSSIAEGPLGILTLLSDATTLDPRVVWLEAGAIRSVSLVPSLTVKPTSVKGSYSKIIDIGLQDKGHFIALNTDDTGRVLSLDTSKAGLKVIWEFEDSVSVDLEPHLPHC